MSTIIQDIENQQKQAISEKRKVPRFDAGDRVRVHFQVTEGTRTRTQVFEGVVIKRQGSGMRETFTVRKQSFGVGVERTFPVYSPKIEQLEVASRGAVRRAKLYYLRDRVGKAARVAERRWGITDDVLDTEDAGPIDAEGEAQEEVAPEVVDAPEAEAEGGEETEAASDTAAEPAEAGADGAAEATADAGAEEAAEAAGDDSADSEEPGPAAEAVEETAQVDEADADADGDSDGDPSDDAEGDEASKQDG